MRKGSKNLRGKVRIKKTPGAAYAVPLKFYKIIFSKPPLPHTGRNGLFFLLVHTAIGSTADGSIREKNKNKKEDRTWNESAVT